MKFTSFLVVCGYFLLTATSLPQPGNRPSHWKVPCDKVSKYSVDWFIKNAPKARKPSPSACLFYTYRLSDTARRYAKKARPPLTTIWDVWPGGYYNKDLIPQNPLRCIMRNNQTDQPKYFSHMSAAYAALCQGDATVMDSSVSPTNLNFHAVNMTGIWFKFEFPMLKKGYLKKTVDSIKAISPDGLFSFTYWQRPGFIAESSYLNELKRRSIGELFSGPVDYLKETISKTTDANDSIDESYVNDRWWEDEVVFDDIDYEDWELD